MTDRDIIWHDCSACGNAWPFPFPSGAPEREWICQVCASAAVAEAQRKIVDYEEKLTDAHNGLEEAMNACLCASSHFAKQSL